MCECGNRMITLLSEHIGELIADSEPYENGVKEPLSSEDEDFINGMSIELNFNVCSKCKSIRIWINGDEFKRIEK